jgi:hypothetical protein
VKAVERERGEKEEKDGKGKEEGGEEREVLELEKQYFLAGIGTVV